MACLHKTVVELGSSRYPDSVAALDDAPERLYCIGNPELLARTAVAVIGARKATPYGLGATRLFAGWLASHGVCVVSGAAMGCDQEAHKAALDAEGDTVAVLGCGADVNYPSAGAALLDDVRRRGLVVSLEPWGAQPRRWTFLKRNRLIAALSTAVLVVEAALPSGTFSTADFALGCGRSVFAVPGSIFSNESRGSNRLIRQGAAPIADVSDLADELGIGVIEQLTLPDASTQPLLAAVLAQPMRPDDLAYALGISIIEVGRDLGRYEREGVIARYPDGRYGPCAGSPRTIQSANDNIT